MSNPGPSGASELDANASGRLDRLLVELADVEHVLWLIVLSSLTLDVYLTFQGLKHGLSEWNPIMKVALETFGFPILGLVKALVFGFAGFYRAGRPDLGALVPLALAIPWLLTVVVNLVMLGPLSI